jgi:hypothetical protein
MSRLNVTGGVAGVLLHDAVSAPSIAMTKTCPARIER